MNQLLNRLFARSLFNSADKLDEFAVQVIQKLHRAELHDAARTLEDWRAPAYTTGSEWLGELGIAIRKIQKQYKIDKDINADLNRLLAKFIEFGANFHDHFNRLFALASAHRSSV